MKMTMQTGMMSRRRWLQSAASLAALALLSSTLSACGGSSSANSGNNATKLEIGCKGEELAFDQTTLTAPAGAAIELTFHNHSNHLQHNWVLVNGGDAEAQTVYEAAVAAGVKNDWLPPASPQIIAHTPLISSGKSFALSFQAPEQAGSYLYLCTFPGHFLAGMKGTLTLT
jgi:azurin